MKTICFFSALYLPNTGGVEHYTQNLAKQFIKHGYHVIIITSNLWALPEHVITEDGIHIYYFPCFPVLNGRFPILKINSAFWKLHHMLQKETIDFIVINTRFYLHSLYGAWFAHNNHIPCILIEHGSHHNTIGSMLFDKIGADYEHIITWCIKRYCKNFYGVSKETLRWLTHFHIRGKGTLYNCIDYHKIMPYLLKPIENYRKKLDIPENSILITYTGRLVEEKGIHKLVKAIQSLEQTYSVHLAVAGDGILYETLKKTATANIHMLGKIDFPHVIALLSQTDIFCLPSDSEGFPTSVLEAAACGCFCIATHVGSMDEIILDESYGIILSGNDPAIIKKAIMDVLSKHDFRKLCGKRIQKHVLTNFSLDKTFKKLEKIVKLSERRSSL